MVQWLRLCISNAGGLGLTPDQGTKSPHATRHGQDEKEKEKKVGGGGCSRLKIPYNNQM